MKITQILKKARTLISEKPAWHKGCLARDAKGARVDLYDRDSCSWCALGAVYSVVGRDAREVLRESPIKVLQDTIPESFGTRSVTEFNDYKKTTHEDVMEWFDRAIKRAESRESRGRAGSRSRGAKAGRQAR